MITDTVFADNVTLRFYVPDEQFNLVNAQVVDASFGRCNCKKTGENYAPVEK